MWRRKDRHRGPRGSRSAKGISFVLLSSTITNVIFITIDRLVVFFLVYSEEKESTELMIRSRHSRNIQLEIYDCITYVMNIPERRVSVSTSVSVDLVRLCTMTRHSRVYTDELTTYHFGCYVPTLLETELQWT